MKNYYVEGELIDEMELENIFEKLVAKYENYFLSHTNTPWQLDMKKYPLAVYPRPISRPIFPKI